jgi:hypothetical protein
VTVIALLKCFYVEQFWEKHSQDVFKMLTLWHLLVSQDFEQIPHVWAAMKTYPRQIFVAKETGSKKFLAEIQRVYAMLFEKLKINSRLYKQSLWFKVDLVHVYVEV